MPTIFFSSTSNCRTRAAQYKHTKQKNLKSPTKQLGLSKPNRTTRPNCSTTTRFRPEPKVQSVGDGFPFSKTDTGVSSGEFTSPKPEQPELNRSYKKIWLNPAKTSQIRRDLDQIQRDLDQIRLYLVGFSQIRPNLKIFSKKKNAYIRKNPVSGKNFSIYGEIFQIPARISNFWRKFQIPTMLFFQISMPFLISATDPTQPTLTITENRTNRFFRRSVSGYSAPPPDAGGSSPGWVKNRPGPTRGQPYKQ